MYASIITHAQQKDGIMPYIDWAIEQDFGVIDINVPHHNSEAEVRCKLHCFEYKMQ